MKLSRRAFLTSGFGALALGAAPVAEVYRPQVTRHTRTLPGLKRPLRVVQLSDLHYGPFIGAASVRVWVDAALRERPDLILVTGDFVDADVEGSVAPLFAELSRLKAPLGVWGVWGNHDYASFGGPERRKLGWRPDWPQRQKEFARQLAAAGVRILLDAGVQVRGDLYLAGLDDLWHGGVHLPAALRGSGTGATLLMSHNPDVLPGVPASVGLTVCGHTHGGQVRLPLVGAIMTSSRYGERFARGFVSGPAPGFVSRGLGVTGLPLRLNCPPEVVALDLLPA